MAQGEKKKKGPRKLERHFKGVANHRRIEILQLIAKKEGITLMDIVDDVGTNFKTTAEHVRRLQLAGLVEKKNVGRTVEHTLTPYGKQFHTFIQTFSHSQESKSM